MEEIIFLVDEVPEGGFIAQSLGYAISTEAETWDELKMAIENAILYYFEEGKRPSNGDIKTYLRCCG
jgi:hypothetical protein